MSRPKKQRNICAYPDYWSFAPDLDESNDTIILSLDEFESIRLIDYFHKTQEQCAAQMNISRTSVTAIYNTARNKIASALIGGKRIVISGGDYNIKSTVSSDIKMKGSNTMRIAVTYENGMIFQHFGKTEKFKLYDIENGKIINTQVVDTNGQGHGALAGFLKNINADVLICGGIGGGAQMAMQEANITLYGGNTGSADDAVSAFISNSLVQNDNPTCDHHGHEHGEGHTCGDHGCGKH
ncbi:MAG: DUF134 domain-containing protein [Firmicutes bacterium]|nr:DUF134 domain-containing protein [Bacillota bacterium]